jgi:dipeptidyl aminopeptidase/acylaminoacyl peptidase
MAISARKAAFTATLLLLGPFHLNAQTIEAKRDPRIDALLGQLAQVRALYQTAISPDGRLLAWVVDGSASEKEGSKRQGTEIELAPLADPEKTTRITAGSNGKLCDEGSLAWSPDSKALAFLSNCQAGAESADQADFFLSEVGAKSAPRRLTHLHGIPEAPAFSPDGKQLAFLYVEGATRRASPLAAEKPPAGVIGEEGLEIKGVWTVGLFGGHTYQVTPASLYTYEFDWSPDSTKLTYIAAPPPGENNWWVAQLYTQPLGEKPTSILDPVNTPGPLHGLQIAVPRWSPDGKQIAFIGGLMSDQGATGGGIYLVPALGGSPQLLTQTLEPQPPTFTWIHWVGDRKLIASAVRGGEASVLRVAYEPSQIAEKSCCGAAKPDHLFSSEVRQLFSEETIGDGRLEMSLSLSADSHKIAFIESSFDRAPEVWAGTLANPEAQGIQSGFQSINALTRYNDALKPSWGKAESITWTSLVQPSPTISASQPDSPKDFNVQGWLLYPANYDPAKKYPLIVYVHGGPSSAVLPAWPEVGFGPVPFAALGYFVLMPNPRGSYGQGEAFTQANRKDFGYGDLRDILAGVDAVTKSHNIDPERVGLTGWSYGGFMTMFAVTQTNRFRAAVAGAGISNWQSYYGENAIDQWMVPFFGASVYDDPAVYAKMSAINFIHNVKTPTLAVVGDRDGECPAPQSFEFWHALKAQHVPTQLVVYPNEGHHFVNPEHQADVVARALDWFQKYMPANR